MDIPALLNKKLIVPLNERFVKIDARLSVVEENIEMLKAQNRRLTKAVLALTSGFVFLLALLIYLFAN